MIFWCYDRVRYYNKGNMNVFVWLSFVGIVLRQILARSGHVITYISLLYG